MPLANIGTISAYTVGDDAVPTTTYVEGTDYEINLATGSIKALSTGSISDAQTVFVDYTFATYETVESVTSSAAPVRWARFEGLNTADGDKAVVVDMYKMSMKPLAELGLINEEITQLAVESDLLSDSLRSTGSKYFTVYKAP